ncbi:hypothetical protein IV417_08410 [Alphaproteobacteria bacterium KMM 3653]|uniref:PH domain-containing protein n=1 Tax=Harenicola maris TaxID=2841044 RepID=A0AAP2CPT5_9RHOB|nr:hypothetical protein [Harenicola maris]
MDLFANSFVIGVAALLGGIILGAVICLATLLPALLEKVKEAQSADILDRKGRRTEKTAGGKMGLGGKLGNVGVIAKAGTQAQAPTSLGTSVLRPTIGLRMISILLTPVAVYLLFFHPMGPEMIPFPYGREVVMAILIYALIYIQTYEVRYDRDGIVTRDGFFRRKEFKWGDLISVKDRGTYEQVLKFETGKMTMQKYLVGMADFLTLAHDHSERNKQLSHA